MSEDHSLLARGVDSVGRALSVAPIGDLPSGKMIDLPGRGSTFVTDSGNPDGPPLILLHALATTGLLTWYPTLPTLAPNYRVITLDLRWHGQGILSDKFRITDCADDVAALADVLGLKRVVAAGFSMGGLVAQQLWNRHHDLVAGLVLSSTAPHFRRGGAERFAVPVLRFGARSVRPRLVRRTSDALDLHDPGISDAMWALRQFRSTSTSRLNGLAYQLARFDSSPFLPNIDVPTAVTVSTKDRVIPPYRQRVLSSRIPGAVTYEVPAGHACCVMAADKFVPRFDAAVSRVVAHADF